MLGKTHRLGGIFVSLGMLTVVPQEPLVIAGTIACGLAGSLFPDLDHKNSTATKKAGVVGGLTSTVFKHRGLLHSPLFYSLIYVLLLPFCKLPFSVFLTSWYFGVLSHLIMDMFNTGGIPLFSPLSRKKFKVANIKTGSMGEVFVRAGMTLACVGFAFVIVWDQFGYKVLEFMTI